MILLVLIAALPVNLVCAYFAGPMAIERGRPARLWTWLAVLWGPFMLGLLVLLWPRKTSLNV
jgi:hypothetical protein